MNIYVLFSLLFFLAPGGCPIYSIDLSTLEVPNEFQNELTLQSMLSSELHQYRNKLNSNEASAQQHIQQTHSRRYSNEEDVFDKLELMRSIEDRIKATHYAAASPEQVDFDRNVPVKRQEPKALRSANEDLEFLGTNLFGNYPKKCFSTEDIALLSARQDFEMLVPKSYPQSLLSDGIVYTLMKYFNSVNQVVREMSDEDTKSLLQRAFYDALGGYLRYYLLPVAQVSFYAGRLKLCTVERLVALFRQCRLLLNTNGNGWRTPVADVLSQLKCVNIKPININEISCTEKDASNCALLDQNCMDDDMQNEQMLVPLPHLESEDANGFLSNIFLPFKRQRIYNLRSPDAAFIVVKFYKTLSSCYRFQGMNPKTYNQKLRIWIRENLQLHYRDEMFYPGLGGILQIYESLGCIAKTPDQLQNEPKDQDMSSRDYDVSPEGDSSKRNRSKVDDEQLKINKQKEESIKQSRSLRLKQNEAEDQGNDNSETPMDVGESRNQLSAKDEECTDCTDEAYVGYIAAFLALFLLLLLLLICFCVQRNKKEKLAEKYEKSETSVKNEKIEKQTEVSVQSAQKPNKKGCFNSLFRSRRYRNSPGFKLKENNLITGTKLVGSERSEYDLEKSAPHKIADYIYDADTISSTSSLGCHFQRKLIPLKRLRKKRDEYYTRVEKRREKPDPPHRKQLTQEEKDEIEENVTNIIAIEPLQPVSAEDRIREICYTGQKTEDRIREICNTGKHKRQEGGLAGGHDRVFKPCDSDSYRCSEEYRGDNIKFGKRETSSEKEPDKTRKILDINKTWLSTRNVVPLCTHNTEPVVEETKAVPRPTTSRSSDAKAPSKNADSWETTFDEESK